MEVKIRNASKNINITEVNFEIAFRLLNGITREAKLLISPFEYFPIREQIKINRKKK